MDEDTTYRKGFNDGYLLQQHAPEIANTLDKIQSEDAYWQALKAGREHYLLEMKQRIHTHTKDRPEPSKERGMERER